MIFLSVAMIIGLIITSMLIPTHPIFIVFNVIGIFVLVAFGMIMTNVYADVVGGDAGLSDVAIGFPRMNFIIQYLPFLGAICVFIMSIVMYSRGTSIGGGGTY
jgi:hypothetical protein